MIVTLLLELSQEDSGGAFTAQRISDTFLPVFLTGPTQNAEEYVIIFRSTCWSFLLSEFEIHKTAVQARKTNQHTEERTLLPGSKT